MSSFIKNVILKKFFQIELTSLESEIALEAVYDKYAIATRRGFYMSLLVVPAILLLDTNMIVSVLIPVTMVSGTAWFAISLANVKKKFESFGLEITRDLFESFALSLLMLVWLSVLSLFGPLWSPVVTEIVFLQGAAPITIAAIFGCLAMLRIIWLIFIGAMKYDINDSMLAGQNEAAERFYKQALSVLHVCAHNLQQHKSLQVANYYIGVSFWEIFTYVKNLKIDHLKDVETHIESANQLIHNPSMGQKEADKHAQGLIQAFLDYCSGVSGEESQKSFDAIQDEMSCLRQNTTEDQDMVDTRLSVIFQEIGTLLEHQGETLFRQKG